MIVAAGKLTATAQDDHILVMGYASYQDAVNFGIKLRRATRKRIKSQIDVVYYAQPGRSGTGAASGFPDALHQQQGAGI